MNGWTRIALIGVLLAGAIAAPLGQGNYFIYVLTSWLIFSIAAIAPS